MNILPIELLFFHGLFESPEGRVIPKTLSPVISNGNQKPKTASIENVAMTHCMRARAFTVEFCARKCPK